MIQKIIYNKCRTTEKGIFFAIIINMIVFVSIPYITKISTERQISEQTLITNKIDLVNIDKFEIVDNREIQQVEEKKTIHQKQEVHKDEISRDLRNISQENLNVKNRELSFDLDFNISSSLSNISIMKPQFHNISNQISDESIFDFNRVFDEHSLEEPPRLQHQISPVYPSAARRMQIEGFVKLEFIVNTNGRVTDVNILESEPGTIFNRSAENTIKQSMFTPGKIRGQNVKTKCVITINYELN